MINKPPGKFWCDERGLHVDTRGLHAPDPMVAILWQLENSDTPGPIIAYLEREPIYLFPELAERGCTWEVATEQPGEVQLIIRHVR